MYRIRIDIPGYTDKEFTVLAQCSMPVPTAMPGQGIGQTQLVTMVRDVMICTIPEDLKTNGNFKQLVQLIGRERLLFAALPEQLLEILPISNSLTLNNISLHP